VLVIDLEKPRRGAPMAVLVHKGALLPIPFEDLATRGATDPFRARRRGDFANQSERETRTVGR